MTLEEKVIDLLAEGVNTVPALERALNEEAYAVDRLCEVLSDLTEQEFAEVTNLNGRRVRREGDRILDFSDALLALTPAGVKRWMLEDARRDAETF